MWESFVMEVKVCVCMRAARGGPYVEWRESVMKVREVLSCPIGAAAL